MYILLVEDDPDHMALFKTLLEQMGHAVDAVPSKDKAAPLLRVNKYDVAVIDFVLVGSMGDTVAREAFSKGIGVVMMTAAENDQTVEDAIESLRLLGCKVDSVLRKPLNQKILMMAVEEAYRNRQKAEPTPLEG